MIKQTRKPIQLTKSMLINILRGMEAKHLKSATIYDRDSEEHVILSIEEIKYLIDLPQQNYRIPPTQSTTLSSNLKITGYENT